MFQRALVAIVSIVAVVAALPAAASATLTEVGAIKKTNPATVPSCTTGPLGSLGLEMEAEKNKAEKTTPKKKAKASSHRATRGAHGAKVGRHTAKASSHGTRASASRHATKAASHRAAGAPAKAGAHAGAGSTVRGGAVAYGKAGNGFAGVPGAKGERRAAKVSVASTSTTTAVATETETGETAEEAPCLAVSRTTGYQTKVGAARNPLVIPHDGRIVAWSIQLGRPTPAQIKFFDENEGGAASAGIAILQPVKKPKVTYKLIAESSVLKLERYFGLTVQLPLAKTIKVKKGDLVALTVPTWAPALALGFGKGTSWRASRQKGECSVTNVQTAQTELKSKVQYFCSYLTARLAYSATLISTP